MLVNVTVILSKAILCIAQTCYPVLVGTNTPIGTYPLIMRLTDDPGYHGSVMKFKETDEVVYAVHRVWTLKPSEHRMQRLNDGKTSDRINVTNGCINVSDDVYKLVEDADTITIIK